ncbi:MULTISPECIES: hypothetical protein [unclassified Ensifer]|uniref:hypothetical protein n=1 Tax=unclassified Ensifer TaxID=2633371 RepID=UPI000813270E|nr:MULTISPECIES: hypothetical protein [unclassified Ensifer]OCO98687.1 hypothetical protein BC362_28400 [Ensifer sp. LC14]OCP13166.1 hypothetical protein BC374_13015 [Ensifer sp. LC13]OCP13771.1 hypothetical protein BBX50_13295 [Ensifer sp. LC11]OCP28147.1 hypothetical protein BC364_11415 [Ensifer sp. LC499]
MLFPTQQSAAAATTNLVGSIVKDIEKRQAEEEEKVKSTKDDKILKAQVKSDDARKAANEKINTYFFDRSQGDASNNRAVLIREVGKYFDLDRETFKSDSAFAREVENQLKALESGDATKIEEVLGLDKLGISLKDLIQALKNPDGVENETLKAALGETGDKGPRSQAQAAKAVDRLESAAEPGSLEEAQLASLRNDPTRGTDKQSLAEQSQQLRALQLQDELENIAERREAAQQDFIRFDENGLYSPAAQSL